jgi:Dolichyl-phosphate-mannose-protein mannosyltransferase
MIERLSSPTRPHRELVIRPALEHVLFVVIFIAFMLIRASSLMYNTLSVDEAIYVLVGRDAWHGVFGQNATAWSYGSYLYPLLAAQVEGGFGVAGLRGMSVAFSALAMLLVFLTATRLYGVTTGLWASLIFGATGVSINLAQTGVYDMVATSMLAGAFYCVTRAGTTSGAAERSWLHGGAILFVVAVLTKYFVALYLPALFLIGLEFYLIQRRSMRTLLRDFLGWVIVALVVYGASVRQELATLLYGSYGIQPAARAAVALAIWQELMIPLVLALGGVLLAATRFLRQRGRLAGLFWVPAITLIATTLVAGPLYHIVSANLQSAWKHTIYSLVFLAPLAGFFCDEITTMLQQRRRMYQAIRVAGMLASVIGVGMLVNTGMERNWGYQHSWPAATGVVEYLQQQGMTKNTPILAEGGHIYRYYLGADGDPHGSIQNTWYVEYGDATGIEAMRQAIRDHAYAAVVLDGYYTPDVRAALEPTLQEAGYRATFEEVQDLSTAGRIVIRVYTRP